MSSAAATFNRYELKYWLDGRMLGRVLSFLGDFMVPDRHSDGAKPYRVTSLYLDDFERGAYYEKYNGDNLRKKYRVRYYEDDCTRLFFEIKHKRGSFVTKTRRAYETTGDISEVICDLKSGLLDEVLPEFAYYVHRLGLRPAVWTAYERTALVGRNNPKLRITFDHELAGGAALSTVASDRRLEPLQFDRWNPRSVMEIKFDRFFPYWLETLMRELNLRQESISKYGMVMNRCLFQVKEPAWTH